MCRAFKGRAQASKNNIIKLTMNKILELVTLDVVTTSFNRVTCNKEA